MKRKDIIKEINEAIDTWIENENNAVDPSWRSYCRGRWVGMDIVLGMLEE